MLGPRAAEAPSELVTVTGAIAASQVGIADAHNHVWIAPVAGAAPDAPVLNRRALIASELRAYRDAGGGAIIDCQPGGCGRDGRVLAQLSAESGVWIVAATGFHRRRYYPEDHWLFEASPTDARAYFVRELTQRLEEAEGLDAPVRAGFIKVACEASLELSPLALLEAAAEGAGTTGAAMEIHTEQGADAERIVDALAGFGLEYDRLVLCHMDKRPDFGLHRALAERDVMLSYDTFYRQKYRPDENLWPLLDRMLAANLGGRIAVATDMADPAMWSSMGGGPGLSGILAVIRPRLEALGADRETVESLLGANIAHRLAVPSALPTVE